jgi:hypothetical protein
MALEGNWRKAVAIVAVTAGVAYAGCGDDGAEAPTPDHPIVDVVERLQSGFADRDIAAICRLMTPEAQKEAGEVAHSSPTTCLEDVRKVFRMIDQGGGWIDGDAPRVASVEEDGTSATVTLASGAWRATVPFERAAGGWKVGSFVGVGVKDLEQVERSLPEEDFPTAGSYVPVKVGTYAGYECTPLSEEGGTGDLGGCPVRVSDRGPVPIEMLTPYGGFKFGDCFVDYRISIDDQGRTWTDEWEVEGSNESGCSDVNPCILESRNGAVRKLPWKGRIVATADGEILHRTNACIRTCIGMFTGELVTRLVRDGSTWRVEPSDRGATGIEFDASLDLYGRPLRIRTAG